MKLIALIVVLTTAASAHPRRWELIPTKDGGFALYDLTQPLPDVRVSASDVVFELYTQKNPSKAQVLTAGDSYTGNFDASKQTKFIAHGWMNSGKDMSAVRDAWIEAGDYNVIVVDWSAITSNPNYSQAKASVPEVGEIVADFIDWIASLGASTGNIQLAGHSLGAQVCGVAGNRVTAGRLNRITGLDPALPLFEGDSKADRLDASDASFVQVIHTNAGTNGWEDAIGTADFYPNGGSTQPGCWIDIGGSCSHGRSTEFFAESITTNIGFKANQCDSWNEYSSGKCAKNPTALMGEYVSTSASGTYYLETGSSSPYALG